MPLARGTVEGERQSKFHIPDILFRNFSGFAEFHLD
jgi:hypothetical protein